MENASLWGKSMRRAERRAVNGFWWSGWSKSIRTS